MNIHLNGNATGCCYDIDEHLSLGDASESSLYEIWHGDEVEDLREYSRIKNFQTSESAANFSS